MLIFLETADHAAVSGKARDVLARELPLEFKGYPINWTEPDKYHVQIPSPARAHPVNHRVVFHTVGGYIKERLGLDGLEPADAKWFAVPEQALLEFTAGEVFHDEAGTLTRARQAVACYPDRIRRALLASEFGMISEEMALVGRAGQRGDDLGSAIIAARHVKRMMHAAFLLARQYAPYPKWFGTAFKRLPIGERLGPVLLKVVGASDWREREGALADACILLVGEMVATGIIPAVHATHGKYFGRDQVNVDLGPVIAGLSEGLDETLLEMAELGSTSQLIDESRQFKFREGKSADAIMQLYEQRKSPNAENTREG